MQTLQAERESALKTVRDESQARIRKGKAEIEASAVVARQQIETAADQLSESVLRAVLPKGTNLAEARQ